MVEYLVTACRKAAKKVMRTNAIITTYFVRLFEEGADRRALRDSPLSAIIVCEHSNLVKKERFG